MRLTLIALAAIPSISVATLAAAQQSGIERLRAVTQTKTQTADQAAGEETQDPAAQQRERLRQQALSKLRVRGMGVDADRIVLACGDANGIDAKIDEAMVLLREAREAESEAQADLVAQARARLELAQSAGGCEPGLATSTTKRIDDTHNAVIGKIG